MSDFVVQLVVQLIAAADAYNQPLPPDLGKTEAIQLWQRRQINLQVARASLTAVVRYTAAEDSSSIAHVVSRIFVAADGSLKQARRTAFERALAENPTHPEHGKFIAAASNLAATETICQWLREELARYWPRQD